MSYPGLHQDAIKYTDPKMVPYLPTSEKQPVQAGLVQRDMVE